MNCYCNNLPPPSSLSSSRLISTQILNLLHHLPGLLLLHHKLQPQVQMATDFKLIVRRRDPLLVPPAKKTSDGLYFLSNLDQNVAVIVRTVYCYAAAARGNESAAESIKGALAKVLVEYYPLAGRLIVSPEGKLAVDCTGDGAFFVEADADCDLTALGDISTPDPSALQPLICNFPTAENSQVIFVPLLTAQVSSL